MSVERRSLLLVAAAAFGFALQQQLAMLLGRSGVGAFEIMASNGIFTALGACSILMANGTDFNGLLGANRAEAG